VRVQHAQQTSNTAVTQHCFFDLGTAAPIAATDAAVAVTAAAAAATTTANAAVAAKMLLLLLSMLLLQLKLLLLKLLVSNCYSIVPPERSKVLVGSQPPLCVAHIVKGNAAHPALSQPPAGPQQVTRQ
jgi:hypothetical protein